MEPLSTRVNQGFARLATEFKTFRCQLLDLTRPIGSYYWSSDSTDPAELFGGTWERIRGKFIYAEDDDIAVGTTGGEKKHTLTVAETPAHTHTRGTMNITGTFGFDCWADTPSGAFLKNGGDTRKGSDYNANAWGSNVKFDAAGNWSGSTSSVGGGEAHNNMPPYEAAYCWKRTG